jgi:plastocyanin
MRLRSLLLPALAAAVVAALALTLAGSRSPRASQHAQVAQGRTVTITIVNYAYHPANLTVKAGTTITVINRDMTAHTLTANDGAFDTGTLMPEQSKRLVLRRVGTFPYHCLYHAFMTGTLKVVG